MSFLIRWLPLLAALLQLIGTALIVWGLKVTSDTGAEYYDGTKVTPYAGIVREHPWAITSGVWLLLLGLAIQVVVAGCAAVRA
jgi:hypothetical protein